MGLNETDNHETCKTTSITIVPSFTGQFSANKDIALNTQSRTRKQALFKQFFKISIPAVTESEW
jgi:hypothetical protein